MLLLLRNLNTDVDRIIPPSTRQTPRTYPKIKPSSWPRSKLSVSSSFS